MRIFWGYVKEKAWLLALLVVCTGLFALVLALYDLPAEAAGLFPTGSGSPRKKQSFYL